MPSTPPGTLQLPAVTVERVVFMGLPKKGAFQAKLPSGQVSALAAGVCHLEQWVVRCILWVAQSRGSVPSHPQASGLCGVVFGLPNMGALVTSSPSGQVEKNVQRWKLQACTCARMLMLQSNAPCLWKLYAWAKEVAGMHVCAEAADMHGSCRHALVPMFSREAADMPVCSYVLKGSCRKLQTPRRARMLMLQSNALVMPFQSFQVVDLELEPISVVAPRAASAHVLRKPDLPISQDWTVETGLLHVLQRTPVFSLYFGARDNRYKRKCTPNITLTAIIGWRHISPKLKYT
eukprot:scaffold11804_cov18-Tisochrysis_lutea.AAC.3